MTDPSVTGSTGQAVRRLGAALCHHMYEWKWLRWAVAQAFLTRPIVYKVQSMYIRIKCKRQLSLARVKTIADRFIGAARDERSRMHRPRNNADAATLTMTIR